MGGEVILLLAALAAFDPQIDTTVKPWSGVAIEAGVQRLHDDFGLTLGVSSPHFWHDRLSVRLVGGVGWFPDLRSLPMSADESESGAWSTYGHTRLLLNYSVPIALPTGRLYASAGPSIAVLSSRLSSTRVAVGGFGLVGVELFTGDGLQTFPAAFYLEIGGVAHAASADIERRTGIPQTSDATVDRPIATGFAVQGGLRFYLWR